MLLPDHAMQQRIKMYWEVNLVSELNLFPLL